MFECSYLKLIKERIEGPKRLFQVILNPKQISKTAIIPSSCLKDLFLILDESADTISTTRSSIVNIEIFILCLKASGAIELLITTKLVSH